MNLHERMMRTHGIGGNHKGMPKDISSYEVKLKSKRKIAGSTYEFVFEKPKGFTYKAGQHGRMTLINPSETDAKGDARFLSFASIPSESHLKFAMRMSDSAFKRTLGRMQLGEKVLWQMRKQTPHGSFALQDAADAARPAVFLVGGIGIVPVFSVIKDALIHEAKHTITLIYSNRRPEDAPYLKELTQLAKRHSDVFTFVPTMTELKKSKQKAWQGETKYITEAMVRKYVSDIYAPVYFIAGLTEMVAAMQKLLARAGVKKDAVRAEEFGAFTTAHTEETTRYSWKQYLSWAAIGILVTAVIAMHALGLTMSHAVIGVLAIIIVVKVFLLALFAARGRHSLHKKRGRQ